MMELWRTAGLHPHHLLLEEHEGKMNKLHFDRSILKCKQSFWHLLTHGPTHANCYDLQTDTQVWFYVMGGVSESSQTTFYSIHLGIHSRVLDELLQIFQLLQDERWHIYTLLFNVSNSITLCNDDALSLVSLHQEFPASWCWSECGLERSGGRVRHWHRGRRRRERHRPAAPAFRGHDPDSDLRWGAGALWPHRGPHPIYKISVRIKHHLIHSTSKQQEQIGDFHLLPLHPVGLTGWDGNRNMLAVDLTAVSSVDVIYPYCLKPSSCVRSREYWTGMKTYWLLWDDVWTVCLTCCLILTCTVIQSPSTPCKCSNQSVLWVWVSTFIPLPIPLLWLLFTVGGFVISVMRLLKKHAH